MVFMADLRWSPCALGITSRVGSERRRNQYFLSTHPGCVESHTQGYTQREQAQGSCPVPRQLGTPGIFHIGFGLRFLAPPLALLPELCERLGLGLHTHCSWSSLINSHALHNVLSQVVTAAVNQQW